MAECANHPGRQAVLRCVKCKRWYCESCAEGSDTNAYCFSCLQDIAMKTKQVKYGSAANMIILGAALSAALGILLLYEDVGVIAFPSIQFSVKALQGFASTPGAQTAGLALGGMTIYFILAIGIIANRKWSYYLGLLANAGVFYWKSNELYLGIGGPTGVILYGEALALGLLTAILLKSKKKLNG